MQHMKTKLINLQQIMPNIKLDIHYATPHNFTNATIYTHGKCYLIEPAAHALQAAAKKFQDLGYNLKIWDGYRPFRVQQIFWNLVPDERYVANPAKGSRHNRGCSIDLTLTFQNQELDMGTDFDDFSEKSHRDYFDFNNDVLKNRQLLQEIMEKHHFVGWLNEWWHFDYKDWEQYPLLDINFDEIEGYNDASK